MGVESSRRTRRRVVGLVTGVGILLTAIVALAVVASTDRDVEPPVLSVPSGYVDHPFVLAIEADGPILVTLDGSYPDPSTNPATRTYDDPLVIEDPTGEVGALAALWTGWSPSHPFRRASTATDAVTVVRARTSDGPEAVATYLPRRRELPVVSIASDPDHLFDPATGIYVPGLLYEEYRAGPDFDPDHGWDVPANAHQRGRQWERPPAEDLERAIVFTYCPPHTEACTFTQNVGVRIHGGFSRSLPAKSLRLYARNDYGHRRFDHPLFGDAGPVGHRRLILRNSGNDWGSTMLLDGYLHHLARDMTIDTQAYEPVVMFLNGEYWGIHNLRERYDRHYLEVVHGVDADQVVVLGRHLEVEEGRDGDDEPYRSLLRVLLQLPLGDPQAIAEISRQIDVDNLFDYVILQTFTGNTDWPQSNLKMWRVRAEMPAGDGASDGRWRWLTVDLDRVGNHTERYDPAFDALERLLDHSDEADWGEGLPLLMRHLLADDAHRNAFVARYLTHLDTTFAPTHTLPELDRLASRIEGEMEHHVARWAYPDSVDAWHEQIDVLRAFMRERPHYAQAQLLELLDPAP